MKPHFHEHHNLKDFSFLVTGGAGFIGSNLVEYLLHHGAREVRVLDNLSTGNIKNISGYYSHPNFKFIEGDIRNPEICIEAIQGVDFVSHQAALGSVPRSIVDPLTTNSVNVDGFLNVLKASKDLKVRKMIYASSSSVYGDTEESPKTEGREGKVMSPYALTKLMNEEYARVFSKIYGFHTIGLRYFNIFGPKQNPNGDYAAVIPRFIIHAINKTRPTIYGDGLQARDFTFVENAVQANIKAMLAVNIDKNAIFNVGCGKSTSINDVWLEINKHFKFKKDPNYENSRVGDIKNSLASLVEVQNKIGYNPHIDVKTGLSLTIEYFKMHYL